MPEDGIRGLILDTDTLICSVRKDESPKRRQRSKDLRDAMFARRVKWVQCDALERQLEKKTKELLTPTEEGDIIGWKSTMRSRGLYAPVKGEVDTDLRARIAQAFGEREHDIHLVETALYSDTQSSRCVCSGDKKACIPLCAIATIVPELQTIRWLCLDDEKLAPADALDYKLSAPQLEKRRLSLDHPLNLEAARRNRSGSW